MKRILFVLLPLSVIVFAMSHSQDLLHFAPGSAMKLSSGACMSVGGDLGLSASATITQSDAGKLVINGNFQNNGFLSPGSSTVVFAGGESSTFSGNETEFYDVAVDKTQAGELHIADVISIENNFYIYSGKLILHSGDLLNVEGNIYNSATINNNGIIEIGK